MRATFTRFDATLIDRLFQPASDSLAYLIGLDRRRLANLCLDVASVAWILSKAAGVSQAVTLWQPAAAFPRLVLLLLGLVALSCLRAAFRRVETRRGANPLRLAMLPHRGVALALLVLRLSTLTDFASVADGVMLAFAVCALYLGACASPPARRRARQAAASGAW
jgi:hypothetical protein